MEVRIKNNGELVDATIEMIDGVMVVSPKIEKFEPKDGDAVAYLNDGKPTIYIYKDGHKYNTSFYVAYSSIRKQCFFCTGGHLDMDRSDIRPATEEEKKLLFDKLKEEGYEWDAEKKELVKLKWIPKYNDSYWSPILKDAEFMPLEYYWQNSEIGNKRLGKGWVFKTYEECDAFCDKLRQAIEGVKP